MDREAPSNYRTAGTLMLAAGILNVLSGVIVGFLLFFYISAIAIGTLGIGAVCYVCCVWPLLPMAFGVYEILTATRIMNGEAIGNAPTISIIGIVMGTLNGMVPMVLEIIATVLLNDGEVKAWLEEQAQADLLLE